MGYNKVESCKGMPDGKAKRYRKKAMRKAVRIANKRIAFHGAKGNVERELGISIPKPTWVY